MDIISHFKKYIGLFIFMEREGERKNKRKRASVDLPFSGSIPKTSTINKARPGPN